MNKGKQMRNDDTDMAAGRDNIELVHTGKDLNQVFVAD
jgi:hypothetical protein